MSAVTTPDERANSTGRWGNVPQKQISPGNGEEKDTTRQDLMQHIKIVERERAVFYECIRASARLLISQFGKRREELQKLAQKELEAEARALGKKAEFLWCSLCPFFRNRKNGIEIGWARVHKVNGKTAFEGKGLRKRDDGWYHREDLRSYAHDFEWELVCELDDRMHELHRAREWSVASGRRDREIHSMFARTLKRRAR